MTPTDARTALSKAMHGADFSADQVLARLRSLGFAVVPLAALPPGWTLVRGEERVEAATLRERVAALEGALREIANGDNGGGWGDLVAWMRGIAEDAHAAAYQATKEDGR